MPFHFKQFSIDDSKCAMKVGTDSVLLGSWADLNGASHILDIGTGSGLIAIMAAQRSNAIITAIDIDKDCYLQASDNFSNSAWSERLFCIHAGLADFVKSDIVNDTHYDHIISNPPWFTQSLKSDNHSRNRARHNDDLPPEELIHSAASLLTEKGRFSLIIPFSDKDYITNLSQSNGLFPSRELIVIPRFGKSPNRVLIEFIKGLRTETDTQTLTIRDALGNYTPEYCHLTTEFYLNW